MYKKSSPSRLSYAFTILAWVIIVSSIIIVFEQVSGMKNWGAGTRTRIDTLEIILVNLSIAALIASVIAWVFREIRHTGAIENVIVRRFLPIIHFAITATVWISIVFHILESLAVDTRSILTGAGIG